MRFFLIALALCAAPASAETITRTENGARIEIVLSDAIAAYPTLAAFLRGDAETAASDFAADGARRVSVRDEAVFARGRFASVRRETEADLGGALPFRQVEALTWDRDAGDFARLGDFFNAGSPRDEALIAISHRLREVIRSEIWGGRIDGAYQTLTLQATNPDPAVLANFTLAPQGFAFHYSPREIAPIGKGAPRIVVPLSVFAPFLNATGRAVFN